MTPDKPRALSDEMVDRIARRLTVIGDPTRIRLLNELRDGEATEPCKLRSTDELHGFCRLLNEATTSLLPQQPVAAETASEKEPASV